MKEIKCSHENSSKDKLTVPTTEPRLCSSSTLRKKKYVRPGKRSIFVLCRNRQPTSATLDGSVLHTRSLSADSCVEDASKCREPSSDLPNLAQIWKPGVRYELEETCLGKRPSFCPQDQHPTIQGAYLLRPTP